MELDASGRDPVTLDLPYPPVRAQSCLRDDAYAMLRNAGGVHSEMSAVSQYFYNSVILTPEHENFARCFRRVSIVEMHHLNIFATFASQMGLDPRLWSWGRGGRRYWTPSYHRYPREIREVIEYAIREERTAIQIYTRQAETIRDENIVENLGRIILDERRHIELFCAMLEELS